MDYDKLDADLISELEDAPADAKEKTLTVFIHTDKTPGPKEESFLRDLGHSGDVAGRDMFTATLSRGDIDKLSRQPWVKYLKASRKMRPLADS